ncbi:MAG: M61 family peptidase [Crocinitomix sp.]|nr:M61 family peptidase [Crocinitomix sp.]
MNYTITYQNPTQQYIPIEAVFDCRSNDKLELQFPAWRPGRYELGNFAKNVRNFKIVDEKGKQVSFKKQNKDSWLVDCEGLKNIKVTYSYFSNELNAGSTFVDDTQLYVNPVNCLIYMKVREMEPCSIQLNIPAGFELVCGAPHSENRISFTDVHEMMDSPFIASTNLQHKSYKVFGINFHLWFHGVVELDWTRIISDFEKFTKTQLKKFSDRKTKTVGFPVKDYHYLYQIQQIKAYHGVEHKSTTVVSLGPAVDLMDKLYDDFLGVSSHELYHVWNIKSMRPTEMYPYDYSKENFSHLGYVAEGVTTYLGDLFLAESNVKDFVWYKKKFEILLQKHFNNFGRFNYSVAASSWDTWLDGYVKGAPNRKVSIYNEGALLAFAMDMIIRNGSENRASIHDVMKKLYTDFALNDKGYTEQDYKAACELFSGKDLSAFFANFVHGTQPYESILVEALEAIGFTLEMEQNPLFSERILGIKTIQSNGDFLITDIYPGSTAELGGLMLNDQILAINMQEVKADLENVLAPIFDIPLSLKVNRAGRILDLICPNTNRDVYPIYKIEKVKIPSKLNKRIFKSWIAFNWEDC